MVAYIVSIFSILISVFYERRKNYENILMAMPPFPLPIPHPSLSRCFNFFKIIFNELDNA